MKTGLLRWLITFAVMLVAVVEVLDMTIVNVALQPMMGTLGATRDQITWVLTSYIVSAAIMMPLTGFLVDRLGRKRLLLMNIIGFMLASALCGISNTLIEIVFFRILQGVFGASLIPLSQYIMLDTFPKEERGKAMAIWGIGIMVGPILGPTLGGYITDLWNWRWIFFINIPVCILAFFMALAVIEETPIKYRPIDWPGLILMCLGVGFLQFFLDRGNTDDWFESPHIIMAAVISAISLTIFIWRGIKKPDNIINIRLFANYNLSAACLVLIMFMMGLFSIVAMQPLMMQELMGYTAKNAGLVMAPRGLSSALGMMLVARFITRYDPRLFVLVGLVISSACGFLMSGFMLSISFKLMAYVSLIQGFGIGMFFVPLSTLAFSTLKQEENAEASGLFNFARNLGTSIGISLVSTYVARSSQQNWNYLVAHLQPSNPVLQAFLQKHHWTLQQPETLHYFGVNIARQASMVAFVNAYWVVAACFLLALPLVFILKKPTVVKVEFVE